MPGDYKWRSIDDLPADAANLLDGEMADLRDYWQESRQLLGDSPALREFLDRLRRRWAIETGQIEGVYNLDRGITETLVERGIDAAYIPHQDGAKSPELTARIIADHAEVLDGLFSFVKGERQITTGYIKELHAALCRNQATHTVVSAEGLAFERELKKGDYKDLPNNPKRPDGSVHQYCPPELVAAEMARLEEIHASQVERGLDPLLHAAWLHHAFTQIHPFSDGNGRVARSLASLVFIKTGLFPLVVTRDDRATYLDALESADQGDYADLVAFLQDNQRRSVLQALQYAGEAAAPKTVTDAMAALRNRILGQAERVLPEWDKAKSHAGMLQHLFSEKLKSVAQEIHHLYALSNRFIEPSTLNGSAADSVVPDLIRNAGYEILPAEWDSITVLRLPEPSLHFLMIALVAQGPRFRGFVYGFALSGIADRTCELLPGGPLLVSYREPEGFFFIKRCEAWLEKHLVEFLNRLERSVTEE